MAKTAKTKQDAATKEGQFTFDGKSYEVILPQINIPGIGIRTALEVCADEEAQGWLIENGCVGSVLKEVVE